MIDDQMNRLKVKRGEALPVSKLTTDDVILIRQIVSDREDLKKKLKSMTNKAIAEKFEVHIRTIDRITTGETWTHV